MFWKGTVLESVVYILQNSSLYRVFTNVHSQAAFWSFLLTSCSSEGPIIEKSIRRIVSSTAHPKAALSPWKMLSMFLKGSCRGLQKVKSEVMKHSPGHSRSLSVQQWHFVTRKKNHPTPHTLVLVYNTISISALLIMPALTWSWLERHTNLCILYRTRENLPSRTQYHLRSLQTRTSCKVNLRNSVVQVCSFIHSL